MTARAAARTVTRTAVAVGALAFLVPGVWAFLWPASFHEHVARFDPFNLHLLHDVGAFQLGVGVALAGALVWRDASSVVLLGAGAGASVHAVSHILDRHLGGRGSDPWTLSLLALLLLAALVARRRAVRAERRAALVDHGPMGAVRGSARGTGPEPVPDRTARPALSAEEQ